MQKQQLQQRTFMLWNITATLLVLTFFGCINSAPNAGNSKSDTTSSLSESKPEIKEVWKYSDNIDKMDNLKSFFAQTESTNEVDFRPPYNGGSSFTLVMQKRKSEPSSIYMQVSKGQFLTSVMNDKKARIKFDDEPPMNITISGTSDYQSDVIFINPAKKLISKLLKAKKIVIEAEFYQDGTKQAEFDVQNLHWDHK